MQAFLGRHRKVGLDSSVFIFHIEGSPKYGELADAIFTWLEGPRAEAVTSTITMLELLVQPYRLSDIDRVNQFYALLSSYPHLVWTVPSLEIADLGARFRAEHNLRTPDAIQAATAFSGGATGFISNDPIFRRLGNLEVALLDDFLKEAVHEPEAEYVTRNRKKKRPRKKENRQRRRA